MHGNAFVQRLLDPLVTGIARQEERSLWDRLRSWAADAFQENCLERGSLRREIETLDGDIGNAQRLLRAAGTVREFTGGRGGDRLVRAADRLGELRRDLLTTPLNVCIQLGRFLRIRDALTGLDQNSDFSDPIQARRAAAHFDTLFGAFR
jgi:hypothetical protein